MCAYREIFYAFIYMQNIHNNKEREREREKQTKNKIWKTGEKDERERGGKL